MAASLSGTIIIYRVVEAHVRTEKSLKMKMFTAESHIQPGNHQPPVTRHVCASRNQSDEGFSKPFPIPNDVDSEAEAEAPALI